MSVHARIYKELTRKQITSLKISKQGVGRCLSEKEHFCTSVQLQFRSLSHTQKLGLATWTYNPSGWGRKDGDSWLDG